MEQSCVREVTDHQMEPRLSQGITVSFVSQTINWPGHASVLAEIQVFLKSEIRAKNTVHRTRAVEGSR